MNIVMKILEDTVKLKKLPNSKVVIEETIIDGHIQVRKQLGGF